MKHIITWGLLYCAIIIAGSGCSPSPSANDKIVIWHWMTDRDKVFQELAERYKKETGVEVDFELYAPSELYSQKVIASAQAKILPDVYGILDKTEIIAQFIKSGFASDLTAEFEANDGEWERSLSPRALATDRFKVGNAYGVAPGIYRVPIDVMNIQLVYNKNLLKKAGIEKPPSTIEEWVQQGAALKRVGIPVLVSGWGEPWLQNCFAMIYAFNIMGEDKVMATFRGEVSYTDESWLKVFRLFARLRDNKMFSPGIATKTNKDAEQDFALERAAFAFNGSWGVHVYGQMNPQLNYGVALPPLAGRDFPMKIWGGAGSSFVVNPDSPNKTKVIAFLKWLTARDQQIFLAEQTENLPVNVSALSGKSKALNDFAAAMDRMTHPAVWPLNEDILVTEAFDKGIQSIIIGEKTPENVAREVEKVKVRQMEKKKKIRK